MAVVGLSHRTAAVELREGVAFAEGELAGALRHLLARARCREGVLLSTCNRTEVYAVGAPGDAGLGSRLAEFLAESRGQAPARIAGALFEHRGAEAARHLFEVAASLDSQLLGETEILGQTRAAFQAAQAAGTAGPVLRELFERAFFLAKKVRAEGRVGAGLVSLGSAAVELAAQTLGGLDGRRALVIGSGELSGVILRALHDAGLKEAVVLGRTPSRAAALADSLGWRSGSLERLPEELAKSDVVLVSTAAPHYVVRAAHLDAAGPRPHARPLLLIDLSLPRNIDPEVKDRQAIKLYDLDGLEEVIRMSRERRERAAAPWRARLAAEAEKFANGLRGAASGAAARKLIAQADALRAEAWEALQRLPGLDSRDRTELARALERFQDRLLHAPLAQLKAAARAGEGAEASAWLERLFALESESEPDERAEPDDAT